MTTIDSASTGVASLCPVCDGDTQRHLQTDGYWIRVCKICTHQFLEVAIEQSHTEEVYHDGYFFGDGAGYGNYLSERDYLIAAGRKYGEILTQYQNVGSVLDVGSAAGFILEGLAQSGWDGEGLEPNGVMVDYANATFSSRCHKGALESFQSDNGFDAITMIQVVPHFYDLVTAFNAAERITRPGGVWLIELWNTRSITAKVLGKHWHEYDPPSVLNWFSERSIRRLAERFGMRRIGRGRPGKCISGSHLKSVVEHSFPSGVVGSVANRLTRLIPDRLVVPYPGDDVFWVAFRKQK